MTPLPALLALESNLRRAGYRSAASGLAGLAMNATSTLVRYDQGREVRIVPDGCGWRAYQCCAGKPPLLVATERHALVDRPPPRVQNPQVGVRFKPEVMARLRAAAELRPLSVVVTEAVELWLTTREVAHVPDTR
jgi:hypothetical protein